MPNDSDARSGMSLSSIKSEGSTGATLTSWRNVALHDRCNISDMEKIKQAFDEAYRNKMLPTEFRHLLRTTLNVEYDDNEFKRLFMKINTSHTGEVNWDELLSHLILGYFSNDVAENQRKSLQLPIMGLPTIMRSQHRQPISRICFCPEVAKDRSTNPMQGTYLTASREGMINWWSLDMKLLRTANSSSPNLKVRTTWVTDMVCMPDVSIIVTSSTERDLRFYDCTAKTFTLKIIITSWEYMPHMLPDLHLVDLLRLHPEWVRQVSYYASLHCVVSCATCYDALLMCDIHGSKTHNMFKVDKGIQCFVFDEESHVLVTGGPDCVVRVWNPFVTAKASVVFYGHHTGITYIVLQNKGQTIYSLSRDRTIKVWDMQSQECIQTYIDIPAIVGERSPISAVYNPASRTLILAAIKIVIVVLDEQLNPLQTDGFTHSSAVSKVLYNPLFKVIITCGMDSILINWNPVTGNRNVMVHDAHVRETQGELIPVEITAACFDPGYQMLLTGARNGELKVWNFNTGLCLRVMTIEHMCEVTSCFWVKGRILAVGWNRHVTEFEDTGMAMTGKNWETEHTDDVLAAAVRPGITFATASYNSELVFWKLETGQPYRRFSCTEPTLHIKIHYRKRDGPRSLPHLLPPQPADRTKRSFSFYKQSIGVPREENVNLLAAIEKATAAQRVSTVYTPRVAQKMRHLAVHVMLFLKTRPQHMNVASLLLALENGSVQCWSDHPAGGYQGWWQVIHMAGDSVSAMATDVDNEFLFTGTTQGYVKVWLLSNYLKNETVHVNMPRLRLMFPFLWRDRIEGRAKRSVRDQPLPLLLNSYRAHLRCITTMAYVDEMKIVFTGSADYSVRVWRLSGEYLQTLGSFLPWTLEPETTRFPPDVKKVASFTTFKVWRSGYVSRYVPGQKEVDKFLDITDMELKNKTYGKTPEEPLFGQYFALPHRPERQDQIELDDSLRTVPLYTHLRMARPQPVRRPPTPELVRDTRLRRADKLRKTTVMHASSQQLRVSHMAAGEQLQLGATRKSPSLTQQPMPAPVRDPGTY